MTREPMEPEAGDWVVYVSRRGDKRHPLGGPWGHAKLLSRGVDGWHAKPSSGPDTFVFDSAITRVTLTRGEAIDLVDRLDQAQQDYITERDALKPKFQQRIRDLLNK